MKSSVASRLRQLPRDSALAELFSRHDDELGRGFITRLDRAPVASKRLVFAKALALNVFILAFSIGFVAFTTSKHLFGLVPGSYNKTAALITQDILLFAAILVLVRSTTIPFFLWECRLRISYGFRASEVIVRRPPPSTSILNTAVSEEARVQRSWRMAVRAVDPKLLYSNAGAIISSDYWTMEYAAVLDVLRCVTAGEIAEEDLEFAVWKRDAKSGIWNVCELWRMHEIMTDQQEIAMFEAFLTSSGKEELLNIWHQMMSAFVIERSPSPKAYQVLAEKFAQEGLDYEAVWSHVTEKGSNL